MAQTAMPDMWQAMQFLHRSRRRGSVPAACLCRTGKPV